LIARSVGDTSLKLNILVTDKSLIHLPVVADLDVPSQVDVDAVSAQRILIRI